MTLDRAGRGAWSVGPWLWSTRTDLAVFGGSAVAALVLVVLGQATGLTEEPLPDWAWLVFVVGVDVAHVWSTLFRTYLDREEVRSRLGLYAGVPLLAWVSGASLYLKSHLGFWRVVAYIAVFHFVRQQAGWMAVYRARGGERRRLDRVLDNWAVYAATLYPLVVWHCSEGRRFEWLYPGDFVVTTWLRPALEPLGYAYAAVLAAFATRQVHLAIAERRIALGKCVVVATTAATWWVGIVATNSDWAFTVTNVVTHGVPYVALLWVYASKRRIEAPATMGSRIVSAGLPTFLAILVGLGFAEEALWDRFVWHDREWLFGGADGDRARLSGLVEALVVSLLAVPQVTHYVLDAFLWRRRDTGPAQAAAFGFVSTPPGRTAILEGASP